MRVPVVRCYGSSAASQPVKQRVSTEGEMEPYQVINVIRTEGWKYVEKVGKCGEGGAAIFLGREKLEGIHHLQL